MMRIHKSSSFIFFIPAESKFRMIEIGDLDSLEKMNLEHTDLENCNQIAEPSLFRNRPAPIVSDYKKNNDEQTDVQQTIHDAEMETEQIIERTTTETSNVTKMSFLIDTEWESKLLEILLLDSFSRTPYP